MAGHHSFAVNDPTVWNSLPVALQTLDRSLALLKHNLKTYLSATSSTIAGQHSFAINDPTVWNSLPVTLQTLDSSKAQSQDILVWY